jgi:hypothetical protein
MNTQENILLQSEPVVTQTEMLMFQPAPDGNTIFQEFPLNEEDRSILANVLKSKTPSFASIAIHLRILVPKSLLLQNNDCRKPQSNKGCRLISLSNSKSNTFVSLSVATPSQTSDSQCQLPQNNGVQSPQLMKEYKSTAGNKLRNLSRKLPAVVILFQI